MRHFISKCTHPETLGRIHRLGTEARQLEHHNCLGVVRARVSVSTPATPGARRAAAAVRHNKHTTRTNGEDPMTIRHSIGYDVIFFIALLATALALGAALAHALELPNKINLAKDEYFVMQKAYRGWDQLAYLLVIELIAMLTVAALSRHEPRVLWPTIIAIVCLIASQAVSWIFPFKAYTPADT